EDSRITDPEPAFLAYAQFYDAAGEELGRNVGTELTHAYFLDMGIAAAPQGGYVLFGTDYSAEDGDPEVCACYYDEQGNQTGNKIQINQPDLFPYNHQAAKYNCVAATDDQIIYVWLDNRRHKGWDVYAKITDWNLPAVEEAALDVSSVKLTSTLNRLSYEVPEEAILTVYNSAGCRVAEQVVRGTGKWFPADLSSGVYFARVESVQGSARAKVVVVR
ncbi:T9SS type A sorting domain-containing protein, partial [candidate division WOR-3 bacterium]|nr:T9SS type A sorting domain-containing protein [candidate division WOR-3 bacterium]MBD3363819.1 T9SS type A sorting domain-containing protein [candidate division WOR-3 bacterium]